MEICRGDSIRINDLAKAIYEIGYERQRTDSTSDENTPVNHINFESGYIHGIEDAWECVKKLFLTPNHDGMGYTELNRIFGSAQLCEIAQQYTIQQIIQKVKAWEEENKPTVDNAIKQLENAQRNETLDGYMTAKLYVDKALDMLKKLKDEE